MDFDVWDSDNSILFLVFLPATHPPGPMKKKKEFVVVHSLSCPTLCDPVDCSKPDSSVLHYLLEFSQIHVHCGGDAISSSATFFFFLSWPSVFSSIRVFSNELALCMRWPKYWTFSFSISPSNELLFSHSPCIVACQAPLFSTISSIMSIELVMLYSHFIFCYSLILSPSIFPSTGVISNESAPCIRWPKYWSFSFKISSSNEYSGLISYRIDWFDLLAVQGTQESSPTPYFKSIDYLMISLLYGPTLTSIYD